MIIVNADDFGRSDSINKAILYGLENQLINRTTIMVNMPYAKKAVCEANALGLSKKIGLHLTLDEGSPLTEEIKNFDLFCDKNGKFNGSFKRKKRYFFSLMDNSIIKACSEEINTQMQYYKDLGLSLLHIDSHHHVHTLPSILKLTIPLAKDNGFVSMRLRFNLQDKGEIRRIRTRIINYYIKKSFNSTDYFCDSTFLREKPRDNYSYEVMCHPDIFDGRYVDIIGNALDRKYLDFSHLSFLLN